MPSLYNINRKLTFSFPRWLVWPLCSLRRCLGRLQAFDNASSKADDAQGAINERARILRAGQSASKVTSNCGRFLKELKLQLANLEAELREAGNKSLITDAEYTRRQNQLSTLKGRSDDLNAKFGQGSSSGAMSGYGNDRGQLFGGKESGSGRTPYRDEPDAWRGDDADGIMQGQQTMMRDQDAGLDLIAKSIARQKEMAYKIGDEIEDQNEMLDDLNEGMDNTNRRLLRETEHVVKVTNAAKAGGYCCCIFLLVVAIIVVGVVPN